MTIPARMRLPPLRLAELRRRPVRTVAGLMTGTSMDGLDIAIVDIPAGGHAFTVRASASEPFPPALKAALADQGQLTVRAAARLSHELGRWWAEALAALAERENLAIDLVGVHGQTVSHEHGVATVQLGEPGHLAWRLGCPVVADFRQHDIVLGGCGAPLVPACDLWLFGPEVARSGRAVVLLNLGGIANFTALVPDDRGGVRVTGFDCGPGNMVLDRLAWHFSQGTRAFDMDGAMAASGRVREAWLTDLLTDPFLARSPPRSAGREQYGHAFADGLLATFGPDGASAPEDVMATATEFTARAFAEAVKRWVAPFHAVDRVVIAGGGALNAQLMRRLAVLAAPARVQTSDAAGIPAQLKEAIAFALLASARIDEVPANVPEVTGAIGPALLGTIVEV